MAPRLGIGIITFNRKDVLAETLARVQAHTTMPHTLLVADDGSDDGTDRLLRERSVTMITGQNMGVAWNKNRALFQLSHVLGCEVVILLEDDSFPTRDGWEGDWVRVAQRLGHVNSACERLKEYFLGGSGVPDDPILSTEVAAHCSAFLREAVLYGGYFDSRFYGSGYEHVEYTRRLLRLGYGGSYDNVDGGQRFIYQLIWGGVSVTTPPSFASKAEQHRNRLLCDELLCEEGYRMPWRDHVELDQFRRELSDARG